MKVYAVVLLVLSLGTAQAAYADMEDPRPDRFSFEVNSMIQWDRKNSSPTNAVLFLGSSSIRMWETALDFPGLTVQNRGFGGAHISDVNYYFTDLVPHLRPRLIVFYCGDNDLDAGKSVRQVLEDYREFTALVRKHLPGCRILYLPAKPSLSRWAKWPLMQELNLAVQKLAGRDPLMDYVDTATPMLGTDGRPRPELFKKDGLHLSPDGYRLWEEILNPLIRP